MASHLPNASSLDGPTVSYFPPPTGFGMRGHDRVVLRRGGEAELFRGDHAGAGDVDVDAGDGVLRVSEEGVAVSGGDGGGVTPGLLRQLRWRCRWDRGEGSVERATRPNQSRRAVRTAWRAQSGQEALCHPPDAERVGSHPE